MRYESVDLLRTAQELDDYFVPRVVGRVNDHYIKVAKVLGEFVWHAHEGEDEALYLLRGTLRIELEGGDVVTDMTRSIDEQTRDQAK